MKTSRSAVVAAVMTAALFAGCAPSEDDTTDLGQDSQGLIGGIPLDGRIFDAVGALVAKLPDGSLEPFCTATLVAEDAVLTAKHCVLTIPEGAPVFFATGPDARAPRQLVPVVGRTWDRDVRGGSMGLGSDTAIAHLAPRTLRGVFPVEIGTLEPNDVGKLFASVGYGIQTLRDPTAPSTEVPPSGTRRVGLFGLRGLGGAKTYELEYRTFDAFVAAVLAGNGLPADTVLSAEDLAGLRASYDAEKLLPSYEAFFDGGRFGSYTSSGDSGGPMFAFKNGRVRIVAVTSGVLPVDANVKDPALLGGIYATLGPESRHLVESASKCGALPEWGVCGGSNAKSCSDTGQGRPRPVVTACGAQGKTCVDAPEGATCAASCNTDADCNAIAPNGRCNAGTCSFAVDCKVEGGPFACYLCCLGAHASSLAEAQACVDDCYAAPAGSPTTSSLSTRASRAIVPGHAAPLRSNATRAK